MEYHQRIPISFFYTTDTADNMRLEEFKIKPLLKKMVIGQMIGPEEAKRVHSNYRGSTEGKENPLVSISKMLPARLDNTENKISLDDLCEWYAIQLGMDYLHIDPLKIDVGSVMNVISYQFANENGLLPVYVDHNKVRFVVGQPVNHVWHDELESMLKKKIEFVFSNPVTIDRYRNEFYSLARSINKAKENQGDESINIQQNLEQLVELGKRGQLDAEHHHIIQVVDWLLQYAFDQRASDIHLEPRRDKGELRFRIDGVLHYVYQVPPNVMLAIISRLKTLGRMDISERRRPQDGRLKTKKPDGQEIELRLSTIPTAMGEKMVMRIFDPEVLQRSFNELGITDRELNLWDKFTRRTHGIILVTGPTGSGKTTTLYSTLKNLATSEVNVCTIEDPIEMVEASFNQMQVHKGIDLTFASGVRSLLRQDPDIIMIGEIRDLETAEMAIQASLTGHLVLSTLHTNDACSAITRLNELGIPNYLINATVMGVMAQRLVRTLCPHCKKPGKIDEDTWNSTTKGWKLKPTNYAKAEGCLECRHTGYQGRVGLYEMLELTPEVRNLIGNDGSLDELQKLSVKQGLIPLKIAGAKKASEGLTSLEEVYRVAPI